MAQQVALSHGWTFSAEVWSLDSDGLWLDDKSHARSVVTGRELDRDFTRFTYADSQEWQIPVVMVRLPTAYPNTWVGPRRHGGYLPHVRERVGPKLDPGSEMFRRVFASRGRDAAFAENLLTEDMQEWMLAHEVGQQFQVTGPRAFVCGAQLRGTGTEIAIDNALGFVQLLS